MSDYFEDLAKLESAVLAEDQDQNESCKGRECYDAEDPLTLDFELIESTCVKQSLFFFDKTDDDG
jgi:hypothetical protein